MYVYNNSPHAQAPRPPPPPPTGADTRDAATIAGHVEQSAHPPSFSSPPSLAPGPSASKQHTVVVRRPPSSGRSTFPFNFPPLFFGPSNASSTSLMPSVAEGKAIPVDNSSAAHRISALRELNNHFPSPVVRHQYSKATSAQSTTYSQPVIVRTYSGPGSHSRSNSHSYTGRNRSSSSSRPISRRAPFRGAASVSAALVQSHPDAPQGGVGLSSLGKQAIGGVLSMPRIKPNKVAPWQWLSGGTAKEDDEPKLPPLEAFSFKGFLAEMEAQGGDHDIGSDLDRIAEICARSRYSLSNQYEVHMAPHGSGAGFVTVASSSTRRTGPRRSKGPSGPTLQAMTSDDESTSRHRKRRSGGRRRSAAYGTLETIMSSSRSSEEEKTKKKPASEIAADVRGRAARKGAESPEAGSGSGSPTHATAGSNSNGASNGQSNAGSRRERRKSNAFAHAVIDTTRQHTGASSDNSPRGSTAALVSEPALPQTSSSHLEIRTAPDAVLNDAWRPDYSAERPPRHEEQAAGAADDVPVLPDAQAFAADHDGGISSWIPWRAAGNSWNTGRGGAASSHAEANLRELLKSVDGQQGKGKSSVRGG